MKMRPTAALLLLVIACGSRAATDRYIAAFFYGLELSDAELDAALRAAPDGGASARRRFGSAFSGLAARLDGDGVAYFEGLGALVVPDARVQAAAAPPSWGIDRIDQLDLPLSQTAYAPAYDGSGASVFVIDTGINASHADFAGRVGAGYDFVDDDDDPADCNGHGTHCAGTAAGATYGVAPGATVHAVRVLECGGGGWLSDTIAALLWVAEHPAALKIASLSLGGAKDFLIDRTVALAVQLGTTVVVAAGNAGASACNVSPAAAPEAITVGASNISDGMPSWSNYGACVDILAPGVGITSAWVGSATAAKTISGTSMATPHVAGVAAQIAQRLGAAHASPRAIWAQMRADAAAGRLTGDLRGWFWLEIAAP